MTKLRIILFLQMLVFLDIQGQNYPEGFQIETISTAIEQPAGVVHSGLNNISYVWDLRGMVWAMVDDNLEDQPLLDISEEVGRWKDHGLMSMALDPDFEINGYFYLLYVVDRHHLLHFGTETYHPDSNDYISATIGRLTRYQIDINSPTNLLNEERHIIIGETKESGIPICATSHGVGAILFGTDGTMMITVGDSNSPGSTYNGVGDPPDSGYELQAIEDGILRPDENYGSFRSQIINSLCGKILRIDPETGLGIESNPFYNPENPDSPRSKVWALGLRNPFRITLIPNTGSANPSDGNPGDIMIGDVGDWIWEEINVCNAPGQNFGWPIYQGPQEYFLFNQLFTPDVSRPLPEGCPQEFLYFQDVIVPPIESHNETWESPCGGLLSPEEHELFVHIPPVLSYRNYVVVPPEWAVVPAFESDGTDSFISLSELDIEGNQDFAGSASIGGEYYLGSSFPPEYYGAYFFSDYAQWLRVFHFDEFGEISKVEFWDDSFGFNVHTSFNPYNESIYFCGLFPGTVRKLTFAGNLRPVVSIVPDTIIGPGPLQVNFDASESYDPEGTDLNFEWNFGDGSSAQGAIVSHEFTAPDQGPHSFNVSLEVTDADGKSNIGNALVSLNNTFPQASITSFDDGDLYSIFEVTSLPLEAEFSDLESDNSELDIRWRVFLHHNNHFHLEETFFTATASATLEPLGCGQEVYWYRVELTVSDPQGLTTVVEKEIYPDCNSEAGFSNELVLFPNPASYNFFIDLPSEPDSDISIDYYDALGKIVRSDLIQYNEGDKRIQLNASRLHQGAYVLKIKSQNWSETRRLVVVRNE